MDEAISETSKGLEKLLYQRACFISEIVLSARTMASKSKLGLSVASNATLIRPVHIE